MQTHSKFMNIKYTFYFLIIIGIVNHEVDGGNLTENCAFESACDFNNLSCRLTSHLAKMDTFDIQFYGSEDLAYQATKQAEIWGYVSFHGNFSEAFFTRIWNQIDSEEQTRKESTTQVSCYLFKTTAKFR